MNPITAYVTNAPNTVAAIRTDNNTVEARIAVGYSPGAIAITPDGTTACVLNQSDNTVSVIETATNTVLTTISDGIGPNAITIAIAVDGPTLYVVNQGTGTDTGTVTIIPIAAPASPGLPTTVGVDINPVAIAITPNTPTGSTAYVVNQGSNNATPIPTETKTPLAPAIHGDRIMLPEYSVIYVKDAPVLR